MGHAINKTYHYILLYFDTIFLLFVYSNNIYLKTYDYRLLNDIEESKNESKKLTVLRTDKLVLLHDRKVKTAEG